MTAPRVMTMLSVVQIAVNVVNEPPDGTTMILPVVVIPGILKVPVLLEVIVKEYQVPTAPAPELWALK